MKYNRWYKATRSNGSGACVEVRHSSDMVTDVRDSKDPDGPMLTAITPDAFRAFVGFAAKFGR